ncbi:MAG: hypothetical protein ACI8Q2_000231 [Candidatus Omnitrophota bacterium]|jgi:hypothetical protein
MNNKKMVIIFFLLSLTIFQSLVFLETSEYAAITLGCALATVIGLVAHKFRIKLASASTVKFSKFIFGFNLVLLITALAAVFIVLRFTAVSEIKFLSAFFSIYFILLFKNIWCIYKVSVNS